MWQHFFSSVMQPRSFESPSETNEHDRGSVDGHPGWAIQTGSSGSAGSTSVTAWHTPSEMCLYPHEGR